MIILKRWSYRSLVHISPFLYRKTHERFAETAESGCRRFVVPVLGARQAGIGYDLSLPVDGMEL